MEHNNRSAHKHEWLKAIGPHLDHCNKSEQIGNKVITFLPQHLWFICIFLSRIFFCFLVLKRKNYHVGKF